MVQILVKPVSADCNLACEYCFYRPKAVLYPEIARHRMSQAVLEELIGQTIDFGEPVSFCWQGGEPTLAGLDFYRRAIEFQQKMAAPGQQITNSLQTNAIIIDEDWAAFLAENRFLVGVSLDGPAPMHNRYRTFANGSGSHRQVMAEIQALRQYQVEFNILVLLTEANVDYPQALAEFFLHNDLTYLQFIPCVETTPDGSAIADFSITARQYGHFQCEMFDLWVAEPGSLYVRLFDELLITYAEETIPSCKFKDSCSDYVVCEYNGDIYACDFFCDPQWRLGNITEQPLSEILSSTHRQEFAARKSQYSQQCQECGWLDICHGGCVKYRTLFADNPAQPTYLCRAYRALFAYSKSRMAQLAHQVAVERRPLDQLHITAGPPDRNDPCPCGSGRKYKQCCML